MSGQDKDVDMSACDRANRLLKNGAPDSVVEKAAGLAAIPVCLAKGVVSEIKDDMNAAREQYGRGTLRRNTPEM